MGPSNVPSAVLKLNLYRGSVNHKYRSLSRCLRGCTSPVAFLKRAQSAHEQLNGCDFFIVLEQTNAQMVIAAR